MKKVYTTLPSRSITHLLLFSPNQQSIRNAILSEEMHILSMHIIIAVLSLLQTPYMYPVEVLSTYLQHINVLYVYNTQYMPDLASEKGM